MWRLDAILNTPRWWLDKKNIMVYGLLFTDAVSSADCIQCQLTGWLINNINWKNMEGSDHGLI